MGYYAAGGTDIVIVNPGSGRSPWNLLRAANWLAEKMGGPRPSVPRMTMAEARAAYGGGGSTVAIPDYTRRRKRRRRRR